MTREEAVKIIKEWLMEGTDGLTENSLGYIEGWFHKEDAEVFEAAIKALEKKTKWIPASELLPHDLEPVNITWVNHNPESYYADIKDKLFTSTGVYFNGKWYWWSTLCTDILAEYGHNHNDVIDDDIEIIAWMHLPEPYKPQESEGSE